MSRVITFSRVFPAHHPKKGQPTYFPEKIWKGFYELNNGDIRDFLWYLEQYDNHFGVQNIKNVHNYEPKWHTIRSGNRWKVGDKFSPRVWSGKPYQSKQIIIAPDIEIKKVWDIKIIHDEGTFEIFIDDKFCFELGSVKSEHLVKNDGLSIEDFENWFYLSIKKPGYFGGQIICWNENINY